MTAFNLDTRTLDAIHRDLDRRYDSTDVRIISVEAMPSHFSPVPEIRATYRIAGIEDFRNIQISLDSLFGMRLVQDDIYVFLVRELIRSIEEDRQTIMAQWNRRRDQQLQDQERQRRVARGQEEPEPQRVTFSPPPVRGTGVRISDYIDSEAFFNPNTQRIRPGNSTGFTTTTVSSNTNFIYNPNTGVGVAGGGAGGSSIGSNTYVRENTLTFDAAEALFKKLLQEKLESLDIRISLDESDGDVTAEVEVILDGKVIASDSDSITIG